MHRGNSAPGKGRIYLWGRARSGIASCHTPEGWSAPAFVSVGGGNWGLQIGVEGVDIIMLVMNDQGFQHLLSSKFELSGDASAAAVQWDVMRRLVPTGK